jgi:hypothetical protein
MLDALSSSEPRDQAAVTPADSVAVEPWRPARRILFRFVFSYFALAIPTYLLYFLPAFDWLTQPLRGLWDAFVPRVAQAVFHVEAGVLPNASGDTTYNYVQVFCFAALALLAAALWTLLDRRRTEYVRLQEWLRAGLRLALAFWMFEYGAVKVIPLQVSTPPIDRLLQPFGDASPEGLFWTFFGASAAYTIFCGAAEMLGGLLLVFRRTALLGALVCIAVLGNVVLLNCFYDVPVKLFSTHLLAMAAFLALPGLGRLANLLVLNRKTEPAELWPLFASPRLNRVAPVLCSIFFCSLAVLFIVRARGTAQRIASAPKPPLYGLWNVEGFVYDGKERPPFWTDAIRWQRVVFDNPHVLAVLTRDARQRFQFDPDPGAHRLLLEKAGDPRWSSQLSYRRLAPDLLAVEGTFDGHAIQARLRRTEVPRFRLLNRGFHWINEVPYSY